MQIPDDKKVCKGRDLAKALAKKDLSREEAAAWRRDLKASRKILIPPAKRQG